MSLLGVGDLDPDELARLVDSSIAIKARPDDYRGALPGRSIGLLFMKPSLRTRVSCVVAADQLGCLPVVVGHDEAGLGSREPPEDVGRVMARYVDLIGMRVFDHADLERVDRATSIPVVNLLSDREHPCQALADLVTIAEHRPLAGTEVAFVGDGSNNVCTSLVLAVTAAGGRIRVASPPDYGPDPGLAASLPAGELTVTTEPTEAVEGADVVYTDVWVSMGREEEGDLRRRRFHGFQVGTSLFELASPSAIFLHCLPAHRGEEVSADMLDHPRSRVFEQAENRLHSFKAILLHLLG